MTNLNRLKAAKQLLDEARNQAQLVDARGTTRGKVTEDISTRQAVLTIEPGTYTIATIEKWLKQAKVCQRKGYHKV